MEIRGALWGMAVLCACGGTPAAPDAGADAGSAPEDGGGEDAGLLDDGGHPDSGPDGGGGLTVPDTYAFESRFTPGTSSVAYGGQVARQVLALDLRRFIDGRDAAIAAGSYVPRDVDGDGADETMAETLRYDVGYFYDARAAERTMDPHGVTVPAGLTLAQSTYGELSATAYLREKVGGNADAAIDHRDWSTSFVGFADAAGFRGAAPDVSSPSGLLEAIFATLGANAQDAYDGVARLGPDGAPLPVHLTAGGIHLGQLAEKFMLGSLAFSQAADKYLDDEAGDPGVGLLAPNTQAGTSPYTALEHAWDEGYGYFGAPRHASRIPLAELVGMSRAFDGDGDSIIDLRSEHLFPTARYAALRDTGTASSASPTHFFEEAELAFRTGRAIITAAAETLTPALLDALRAQRDLAVSAWERALAASAISYLNAVIRHTRAIGTAAYAFPAHAAAWSEMKGFALAFQFHRRSPMLEREGAEERFVTLHALLRDAPVLPGSSAAEQDAYVADLLLARALLGRAYGFDPAHLGDDAGMGGW